MMANRQHVKILKQGAKVWNLWREENKGVTPDFRKAVISSIDLSGAQFHGVNLRHADLSEADIIGMNFTNADLEEADLRGAYLHGSNLEAANLVGALLGDTLFTEMSLDRANLSEMSIRNSYFFRTDLSGTDFHASRLGGNVFADVDLSMAHGLETTDHSSPSTIGIDTIYRSRGKIPEQFLRGCGVPEPFIAHMSSLVGAMDPIQFYSCFISYSSEDREFAERLYADLQSKGVRCWFAPENLKIGAELRKSFDEAIRVYDKLMVVLSEKSIASRWVEDEVEAAFEKERREDRVVLFPIRLDDAVMEIDSGWAAKIRRGRHVGDFRDWKRHGSYKKSFDRLLRDLKSEGATNAAAEG